MIQIHQVEQLDEVIGLVSKHSFDLILFDHSWLTFVEVNKEMKAIKRQSLNTKIVLGWQYDYLAELQLEQLLNDGNLMTPKPLTSDGIYKLWHSGYESI